MRTNRTILVLALLLTVSLVSSAAAQGDNHAASAPCKDGGWQSLERTDGTTFATQGECVRYAVQGGELVPHVPATIWISASSVAYCDNEFATPPYTCDIFGLSGSDFQPNASLTLHFLTDGGVDYTSQIPTVTDGNGAFVRDPLYWPCGLSGTTALITVTDGVNTATTSQTIAC